MSYQTIVGAGWLKLVPEKKLIKKAVAIHIVLASILIALSISIFMISPWFLMATCIYIVFYMPAILTGSINIHKTFPETMQYIDGVNWDACSSDKIYSNAISDCAAEMKRLGDNFVPEPWSKMFKDMNKQVKEHKAKEKQRILDEPRKNWAEEMRISHKLEHGEQID